MPGNGDDQRRHGADDDGVDERFQQGDEAFGDRFLGPDRRVRDCCGTDTCLIGERGALEALDQGADEAAGNTQAGECPGEDLAECPADLVEIDHQDDEGSTDIQDAHERDDLFGHACDGLDATDDNGEHDDREYDAGDPARVVTDDAGDLRMCLIGLEHVAATQCAENAENREQHRQDLASRQAQLLETLGHVVHRATGNGAVRILVAVFDAQRTFGELRGHAHQAGQNHPEGGTRTTDADGHGNTGNVAQTDGARQGCRQCLEVADFTGIVRVRVVALDQRDGMAEIAKLDEAEVERKYRRRDHQPHHDPWKTGAGKGREKEIDKRAGNGGKGFIHSLIDSSGFLCKSGS